MSGSSSFEWSSSPQVDYRSIAEKLERQLLPGSLSSGISKEYVHAQSEIERVLIRNVNEVILHEPQHVAIERISEIPSLVQRLMGELETARRSARLAKDKQVEAEVVSPNHSRRMVEELRERDELLEKAAIEMERLSHRLHETRAQDEAQLGKLELELLSERREKERMALEKDKLIASLEIRLDQCKAAESEAANLLRLEVRKGKEAEGRLRLELDGLCVKLESVEREMNMKLKAKSVYCSELEKHTALFEVKLRERDREITDLTVALDRMKNMEEDLARMGELMSTAHAEIERMRSENRMLENEVALKADNACFLEAVGNESHFKQHLDAFTRELDFLRMDSDHAVRALQEQLAQAENRADEAEAKMVLLQDDLAIAEFQRKTCNMNDWEDERIEMEAEIVYLRSNLGEVIHELSELKQLIKEDSRRNPSESDRNIELEKQLVSLQQQLLSRDEKDVIESKKRDATLELQALVKQANWPMPDDPDYFNLACFVKQNVLAMIKFFDQRFRDMELDIEYLRSQFESQRLSEEDIVGMFSNEIRKLSSQLFSEIARRKSIQVSASELCNKTTVLWDKFHSGKNSLRLPDAPSFN